jgi:hypothetical protein
MLLIMFICVSPLLDHYPGPRKPDDEPKRKSLFSMLKVGGDWLTNGFNF